MKRGLILLVTIVSNLSFTYSQVSIPWSYSLEDVNKVFIENKGQFESNEGDSVYYGARSNGLDIYFTSKGLVFKHTDQPKIVGEETESRLGTDEKSETYSLSAFWLGSNTDLKLQGVEKIGNYFTYSDPTDQSGKSTLKANAYRKLTYKNIYPGIDVEYTFKAGIKYTLIVHPGADLTRIRCRYRSEEHTSEL